MKRMFLNPLFGGLLLFLPLLSPAATDSVSITITIEDVVRVVEPELPEAFRVHDPYPNPFNPATHIRIDVPEAMQVTVVVYDVRGRQIASLHKGALEPGRHTLTWQPAQLGAGVYFVNIETAQNSLVRKLIYTP